MLSECVLFYKDGLTLTITDALVRLQLRDATSTLRSSNPILLALFMFNVGVEAGELFFIAVTMMAI